MSLGGVEPGDLMQSRLELVGAGSAVVADLIQVVDFDCVEPVVRAKSAEERDPETGEAGVSARRKVSLDEAKPGSPTHPVPLKT